MKRPEVLAPAGGREALEAALRSGADAVYVGGKRFSARGSAENFSIEELREAAALCHKNGAKLDLAVNTVVFDDEAEDFCRYVKEAAAAGVDAFIVQDFGCADIIRRAVPDAVLHASTQASVHTAAGARLLAENGFARVVPARELDREAIERICREEIEVEVFTHGALCMSVSGQCYISAMIGGRSANRGRCGQACRLPFSAKGDKNAAALSLKDLSLLPRASELAATGVDSLKIEGRMKRPEYVASAVSELKKALDGEEPDMSTLRGIFSRGGFTDGYFTGKRRDMFGVREKEDVTAARTLFPKIRESYRFERKTCALSFKARVAEGAPVRIEGFADGVSAAAEGDFPEKALSRPADAAFLEKQLSRLGDTIFTYGGLEADIGEGLAVPAGKLNELRRRLCAELTGLISEKNTPKYSFTDYSPALPDITRRPPERLPLRAACRSAEQVEAALELAEAVAAPMDILEGYPGDKERIIVSPPRFIADEDKLAESLASLRKAGFTRLLCHTTDHVAIGAKLGYRLHGSFTLNAVSSYSAAKFAELGLEDIVVSFETDLPRLNALRSPIPLGAVVYGRLPLMLTRNCPVKNEIGCAKCKKVLRDRTGRDLPVQCSREYVEILNPDVLVMTDRLNEISGADFGLVYLTGESAEETRRALSLKKPGGPTTRGLYYRGI